MAKSRYAIFFYINKKSQRVYFAGFSRKPKKIDSVKKSFNRPMLYLDPLKSELKEIMEDIKKKEPKKKWFQAFVNI